MLFSPRSVREIYLIDILDAGYSDVLNNRNHFSMKIRDEITAEF